MFVLFKLNPFVKINLKATDRLEAISEAAKAASSGEWFIEKDGAIVAHFSV